MFVYVIIVQNLRFLTPYVLIEATPNRLVTQAKLFRAHPANIASRRKVCISSVGYCHSPPNKSSSAAVLPELERRCRLECALGRQISFPFALFTANPQLSHQGGPASGTDRVFYLQAQLEKPL